MSQCLQELVDSLRALSRSTITPAARTNNLASSKQVHVPLSALIQDAAGALRQAPRTKAPPQKRRHALAATTEYAKGSIARPWHTAWSGKWPCRTQRIHLQGPHCSAARFSTHRAAKGPSKPRGTLNAQPPDTQTYPTPRAHCQALHPLRPGPHSLEACWRQAHHAHTGVSAISLPTLSTHHTMPLDAAQAAERHACAGSSHAALLRAALREMRRRQPSAAGGAIAAMPAHMRCSPTAGAGLCTWCTAVAPAAQQPATHSLPQARPMQALTLRLLPAPTLGSGRALFGRMGADAQRAASMCALPLPYRRKICMRHGFSARQPLLPAGRPASGPGRKILKFTKIHSCQH